MGSIISAIADDIADYEALCAQFGEKVQWRMVNGGEAPDCYGAHADSLKERARERTERNQLRIAAWQEAHISRDSKERKMTDKKDAGPMERAALAKVEEARRQDQENQWAAQEIQKYTDAQRKAIYRAIHQLYHGDDE